MLGFPDHFFPQFRRLIGSIVILMVLLGLLLLQPNQALAQGDDTLTPTVTPSYSHTPSFTASSSPTGSNENSPTPIASQTPTTSATATTANTPTNTHTLLATDDIGNADCNALQGDLKELCDEAEVRGSIRVIVQVNASTRAFPAISLAQSAVLGDIGSGEVRAIHLFKTIPYMALAVDASALIDLADSNQVRSIQRDQTRETFLEYSSTLIGADVAWGYGYDGSGQTIAILDTGVDNDHPFLSGKVVSEACFSQHYPSSGYYSLCPAYAHGSTAANSADTEGCDSYGTFSCDHGTHVAGIAAGNGASFDGIARGADIIAIQVFTGDAWLNRIGAFDSDIIAGLERVYALRNTFNIPSVNLSLGGGIYAGNCDSLVPAMTNIINNLRDAGIATIIASGNNGSSGGLSFPACISSAIAVGATTDSDSVASFSNSSSQIDLLAPGVNVASSVPGGSFESWNGTSMAAPHVAGAWALFKQALPGSSVNGVLSAFQSTGTTVIDARNGVSKTRLQIDAAIAPTFADVPLSNPLFPYIDALWDSGFTAGCSTEPLNFCPGTILDRAQSAVFILRGQLGSDYSPPGEPWDTFGDDWAPSDISWAEKWAEGMLAEGLTAGCQNNPEFLFCPRNLLTRVEAAVFGLRLMHGSSYVPPDPSGTLFADMSDTSYWGLKWAEQAYLDGLLPACGNEGGKPLFCPLDEMSRAWTAYMIVIAKNLSIP